jgi:hypothetical protein
MSETQTESETDAEPTPGPAYADGTYVVAGPPDGRPNGEVIMRPSGFGNDLPADEQRANARLTATAFDVAQEAKEMGYDPVAAVEALPQLLQVAESFRDSLKALDRNFRGTFEGEREAVENFLNALASAEGSEK